MIQDDATRRQIEAADPNLSTWLSANAGSGKTRVLTDRVARLLLEGTRPENILCLTYTKAAASEMQNRLFKRLGEWAMMPSEDLRKQLIEMGAATHVDANDIANARTLFASAIETPGGLKIQTIHSFCAGILRRFPLEAGVSPQFKEMEDRAAQILREEVLDEMAEGPHAAALDNFAQHYTGAEVGSFLASVTSRKSAFLSDPNYKALANIYGLEGGETLSDAANIAFIGGEKDLVNDLVEACANATATYQKTAKALMAIDLKTPNLTTLKHIAPHLLYADKSSKSRNWPQSRHTKAVEALEPVIDDVHAWMDRTAEAFDYINRVNALAKTQALYAFGIPYVQAYETKKTQRGALDFDDLISKAKALLEDPNVAQWVLFRLDGGVDHVLVDEAQDTSPDQWDIVRLLTQEFSTGHGTNPDRERTVFVVGDKKQSIYSFQGADPEGFDRMREHFASELGKVQKPLQNAQLQYSFRSSAAVLQFVDQTFKGEMSDGLEAKVSHLSFKDDMPGRVDLWPAIDPIKKPEEREWDDPIDLKGDTNHQVVLARTIANQIKRMIAQDTLPIKDGDAWARRKITPGDILILVQRRSDLFGEIISACKAADLEIAGADRLKLAGELAVKDITAVLQFLALQDDDLSLAAALRSPLFGWSEKQLYQLAQPRPKRQSLWEALRLSGEHEETMSILTDLRNKSDFLRPYDLINRLLVRHDGRKKLLERLGHEAEDGIDALLSQALGYETSNVPSLTGFLNWLQTEDVTVKRQMDSAGDRIRVMTVHGSKGLEAPIVILPDTTVRKRDIRGDFLTSADGGLLWKTKSDVMPSVLEEIKAGMLDAQDRERRRLLYVALTRAENWLIVAAAGDTGKETHDSWHGSVAHAMGHVDAVDLETSLGTGKRFNRWNWDAGQLISNLATEKSVRPKPAFGDHLPPVLPRSETLAPSGLGGAKIMPGETHTDDSELALAWGRIIHTLLEILPNVSIDLREATARRLVENHPDAGLIDDIDCLVKEALNVLATSDLDWVFTDALLEVPISAPFGNNRLYGIIDRLIVTDNDVIAIDFKSNRSVPPSPNFTPIGLIRQMGAYRNSLRQIYPNHRIRTVLLWTKNCTITELADAEIDAALDSVTTP